MSAGSSYEEQHIRFVTSENGCSPVEILQVLISISLMPFLTSLLIPWVVPSSFTKMVANKPWAFSCVKAVVEYPIIFIAPLFFITILAGPGIEESGDNTTTVPLSSCVAVTVIVMCIGIIVVNQSITRPVWTGFQGEWNKIKDKSMNWSAVKFSLEKETPSLPGKTSGRGLKLPFVTNYRGLVTYITILSILAVDLVIFPRRFAKTKKFGFSLMDLGTGSFVFANGIVAPEAKNLRPNLKKALKSSIPLWILGFVRLVTIKGIAYPEVEEEYGVHWNFFFTLASVKILSAVIFTFVPTRSSLKLACVIGILYDLFIIPSGFQESFILNPHISRDSSLIAANREGILSIFGYLTIFFASVYVGQVIFYNVGERRTLRDWMYYAGQSGSQLIILWLLTLFLHSYWSTVSRRSANLSYVLWIVSVSYSTLWLQFILCFLQSVLQRLGLLHGPLLFFELRQKNLKKFQSFVESKEANAKKSEDEKDNEEMETTLKQLELKLEKIQEDIRNRKNPKEKIVMADFTKEVEKEMEVIGAKCLAEELTRVGEEMKSKDTAGDLVEMPDLTRPPITLEAICYNGLTVFLLGNLLTGLLNSILYSMFIPNSISIFFLWIYGSTVGFASLLLYWYNVQIKFW